ncbi:GntR family transcriptional regulator [Profundibacterium mesophilum]|uniref:Transcriptional regulatory protein n=1 Tax=Profundibacterium mesophilum KAUST100406-0324 TaxID=1037889 RepID=A0A921TB24_9RHOB|nr:GntR family transcriptional regulator [Profundibacterium mesophilum]KAF0674670.1 Transcriptional regulatory protein [Profundibacterium mesophilum KAUST100406-0324]
MSMGRPALAVELTDRLRRMILEETLAPGAKISEKQLTEQFGVSRTPLREALKVLAAEGLLELVPNRGTVISVQTTADLREIFPVLAVLEGLAGETAAIAATGAELGAVADQTALLRQAFEAEDRPRYFEINKRIHNRILEASRNPVLIRSHALLAWRAERARYRANLTPERWSRAVAEHEAISAALSRRDAADAGALMKAHILAKLETLAGAAE